MLLLSDRVEEVENEKYKYSLKFSLAFFIYLYIS